MNTTNQKAHNILATLAYEPRLGLYVNNLPIPDIHRGTDKIKLIILGQDPTVKNPKSWPKITMVLNLDKPGSLRRYLTAICSDLGLDLDKNVYATNYFKNFFSSPPTTITEIHVFEEFAPHWLPLLQKELAEFPQVPMITLGQPLLSAVVTGDVSPRVRDYWGYTNNWKSGERGTYSYLQPSDNVLNRVVFPFPHQPSVGKQFYADRLHDYVAFVRERMSMICR